MEAIKARHIMQSNVSHKNNKVMEKTMDALWVRCPICGNKTRTKVYENTVLLKFPLYCPKCRKEIRVDVVQLKMVLSDEPDA